MYITGPNPCDDIVCGEGSECQIFEPTGEAFCNPNCEDLNPCGPHQVCTLQPVICVRAPCPPVLLCEDCELINFIHNKYNTISKIDTSIYICHFYATSVVSIDVQLSESGVVVTVEAAGAESIRIILRDSSNGRHTHNG